MVEQVEITAGPVDGIGKRAFMTRCGDTEYPDQFNPNSAYHRSRYRAAIVARFGLADDEPTHGAIESKLLEFVVVDSDTSKTKSANEPKPSQAAQLVELAHERCELWHSDACDERTFATIQLDGHRENWPIRSKRFKRWLAHSFYLAFEKVPSAQAVADALTTVDGAALYDGKPFTPHIRVAGDDSVVFVDVCNADWQVVRVSPVGWTVGDAADVRFRRSKAATALPLPVEGGDLLELRQFLNVRDDDWYLVVAWLLASLRPRGPYPLLALHGEQGSSKSTTARVLRSLVDPSAAPIRCEPRSARDLMIAANSAWIIALDNLSNVPAWLSDSLCRLSTGGGFSTRTLHENDEETIFDATRPCILTGIEELATRSDLLDRSLVINLPRIPDEKRQTESQFWQQFEDARPRILGALLDVLSASMRERPNVKLDRLPRMADFAIWSTAAETSIGLDRGEFLRVFQANQQNASISALEASAIARHLAELARDFAAGHPQEWQLLTATQWLEKLNQRATDDQQRTKAWPKAANALSGKLKRVAPNLRSVGVEVDFDQQSEQGRRKVIAIRLCPQKTGFIDHIERDSDVVQTSYS